MFLAHTQLLIFEPSLRAVKPVHALNIVGAMARLTKSRLCLASAIVFAGNTTAVSTYSATDSELRALGTNGVIAAVHADTLSILSFAVAAQMVFARHKSNAWSAAFGTLLLQRHARTGNLARFWSAAIVLVIGAWKLAIMGTLGAKLPIALDTRSKPIFDFTVTSRIKIARNKGFAWSAALFTFFGTSQTLALSRSRRAVKTLVAASVIVAALAELTGRRDTDTPRII